MSSGGQGKGKPTAMKQFSKMYHVTYLIKKGITKMAKDILDYTCVLDIIGYYCLNYCRLGIVGPIFILALLMNFALI